MTNITPIASLLPLARIYADALSDWLMELSDDHRDDILDSLTDFERKLIARNESAEDAVADYLRTRLWLEAEPVTSEDYAAEVKAATSIYEVAAAGNWQEMFSPEPVSTKQVLTEVGNLAGWTIKEEVFEEPEFDTGYGILPSHTHTHYVVTDPWGDYGIVSEGSCTVSNFL